MRRSDTLTPGEDLVEQSALTREAEIDVARKPDVPAAAKPANVDTRTRPTQRGLEGLGGYHRISLRRDEEDRHRGLAQARSRALRAIVVLEVVEPVARDDRRGVPVADRMIPLRAAVHAHVRACELV